MDASVNMKMTPQEHRDIRAAVSATQEEAERVGKMVPGRDEGVTAAEVREARERAVRLSDILKKL
jgi:N-methylhydantoinase B/oxoprolinase/acetone carboxylase alpha subunit